MGRGQDRHLHEGRAQGQHEIIQTSNELSSNLVVINHRNKNPIL